MQSNTENILDEVETILEKEPTRVAVYGSLIKGLHNNSVLGDSILLGTTKTLPEYTLGSLGSYPGMIHKGDTAVTIEVYELLDSELDYRMRRLDQLEGYTGKGHPYNFYNRVEIDTEFGKAYTYLYNGRLDHDIVEDGDWKKYYNEEMGQN
jgi:gamma-glutamylcyclotransferase (GGCT)/AIG2-like uncharacterized protein YtfP